MSENKWLEFTGKIEHLITEHKKVKKDKTRLEAELEELKKQTAKLARGSKEDVLLKDRIRVLEEERNLVREKVKKLLKTLKGYKK
jgi:predicted nuclease with TOPRIM domain